MRRFFLGFFLILVVLFFNKSFIFAIDYPAQIRDKAKDVAGDVVDKAKEKVEETTGIGTSPQEELENIDVNKVLSELDSQLNNITCGKIDSKCCTKEDYKKAIEKTQIAVFKIPIIGDKIIETVDVAKKDMIDLTNNLDDSEFEGMACQDFLYPVYETENDPASCKCRTERGFPLQKLCKAIDDPKERTACELNTNQGVWTALGGVNFTLGDFIKNTLLGWGIGLAGVVSLLCIIYSAFMMQISGGNPEKLKKTRERLNSCIIGLILIIFSVFILRVIGVDILQIPGFSK